MGTTQTEIWPSELRDPSGRRSQANIWPAQRKTTNVRFAETGQTMIIDKGLGRSAFVDFLELAGPYVDIIKLGFGTSALYPDDLLTEKIALATARGIVVTPGGTLLEAAVNQGEVSEFFRAICRFGFNGVEVSDGTIEVSRSLRTDLIREGIANGLTVLTEYGKKTNGARIDPDGLAATADADWAAGAALITVEARESGIGVGLFDENGNCREELLDTIARTVSDTGRLMWEAPLKSQQALLLKRFGPAVHLGNIPPAEVLSVETMRRGLRSDTFEFGMRPEPIVYMI
ncbi:phosphosulfolactate synthase [Paenibacillus cisolokensis]|uniref:phosphosulfolactate synthase n=1 Tax=Paenibacillus cisolokensis TaxID=1658519 RepID=UPI003D2711A5